MGYTKEFSESFNSSEEMYAFFRMVELETNQGFRNSDANITLTIHCMEMIETGDYETLTQSGDTWISGIPPDLGEKEIFNLGESPRSGGIHFFQPLIRHGSFSDRKEYLLVKFSFCV